jgi:hypothetical protein
MREFDVKERAMVTYRSSKYPLPSEATCRGIRMEAPRLATPEEKFPMCPVS